MELSLSLVFKGDVSDNGMIDFYDASKALSGFERVISLTTHLVLNNEVIVQSPSLRGATIYSTPPTEGSWKSSIAVVLGSSILTAGVAPRDSAVGHILVSAYDYVISESLGFHVDFDSTLGQQYEELHERDLIEEKLNQSRFDSIREKCESGLRDIHRPIVNSGTADVGRVYWENGKRSGRIGSSFQPSSYEYLTTNFRSAELEVFCGLVSSYNSNTYKGRFYIPALDRNLAFFLDPKIQNRDITGLIADNLALNIRRRGDSPALVCFRGYRNESRSGALKSIYLVDLLPPEELI